MLAAVNPNTQKLIELENSKFGDILQGNFIDAYRNLTYKHTMVFKWFLESCASAEYLLKTDDDVFINTPFLIHYLENRKTSKIQEALSLSFMKPHNN
jgi:hypothetical protein